MTKPLTFTEAAAQAEHKGYTLVKYAGSSNAYGSVFKCQCGHQWPAKHNNVVSSNKTGCPVCAQKAARMSEADISAALATEGVTLLSVEGEVRGQGTVVVTKCGHGHVRTSKLGTIIYTKKPCPECSKATRGVDFAAFNARLAHAGYRLIHWAGTTRAKGTFACSCGTTWAARVNSVLQGQSHCPGCFEGGFRGDKPAVFYIYELRKGSRTRYGYGISGRFDSRNAEHKRNAEEAGWKIRPYRIYEVDVGIKAVEVEKLAKASFKVPRDMFYGFKTEAIMPRDLSKLLQLSNTLI